MSTIDHKQEFISRYRRLILRDGAEAFLDFLTQHSDFFVAPASTRFHGAYAGGLVEHCLNVHDCLQDYLARDRAKTLYGLSHYTDETIAIVSLLHDVCKIGCYKPSFRNVKDASGTWQKVPTFEYDDALPYGHGEKSVYIIGGFLRLTREEAFAIRYHMGFSGTEDIRNISKAFELFPLSLATHIADMEASAFLEKQS